VGRGARGARRRGRGVRRAGSDGWPSRRAPTSRVAGASRARPAS
jgi:hypothetical protein